MRKRTVKLHGRHCEISLHREGKHIWLAVGDYLGKEIRAQAESEGAAVKRWRETASTMGATERAGREQPAQYSTSQRKRKQAQERRAQPSGPAPGSVAPTAGVIAPRPTARGPSLGSQKQAVH